MRRYGKLERIAQAMAARRIMAREGVSEPEAWHRVLSANLEHNQRYAAREMVKVDAVRRARWGPEGRPPRRSVWARFRERIKWGW